jgi:F-type H+-transporting ATPase subunit gamma
MSAINEIKEEMTVVKSVGDFTNALQQIATLRMMQLRTQVLDSRPFVEAAQGILKELSGLKAQMDADDIKKLEKKRAEQLLKPDYNKWAVIIITSNQGLTGQYNPEIFRKLEKVVEDEKGSDFYIIGKKGQEYFTNRKIAVNHYPYEVPDKVQIEDLTRLVNLFDHYAQITLVYSRYVNAATREVLVTAVVTPRVDETAETAKQPGKYMYEPNIVQLIEGISKKLRAALFQQQMYDARLSQYAAQMIGMKTASDNAVTLLGDLRLQYNKQRRKLIDKKIGEVFAGSSLW